MNDFLRLLKLAGVKLLLEALTPQQAANIFKHYGASDDDLSSPQKIKAARNRLIRQHHSDVSGGDDEAAKMINASYDVLKSGYSARTSPPKYDDDSNGIPAWQTDKRSSYNSISRDDYTDINYFKRRMWELSKHSTKKYTIYAFDGSFFRGTITVYGSPEIFKDMAEAMVVWNSHGGNPYDTRAVFVQEETFIPILLLIYLDGKVLPKPIEMEHDSFNRNPANDQYFVRSLPDTLDRISRKQKD